MEENLLDGAIQIREESATADSVGDSTDAVVSSSPGDLDALYEAALRLIEARSLYLVGMALSAKFPTEAEFMAFLGSPDFIDAIQSFAEIRTDILLQGRFGEQTAELEDAISAHAYRAAESLEVLADLLGLAPEDIVSVLVK